MKRIRFGDLAVYTAVVTAAVLVLISGSGNQNTPRRVVVSVDGSIVYESTLPRRETVTLDALPYPCTLVLDGTQVSITDVTCPEKSCRRTLSRSGDSAVCLPNRMIVQVEGGSNSLDAVMY